MERLSVETNITIGGKVVERIGEVGNLPVYRTKDDKDEATLFFVDPADGSVLSEMKIYANYHQCQGYVDNISIHEVC